MKTRRPIIRFFALDFAAVALPVLYFSAAAMAQNAAIMSCGNFGMRATRFMRATAIAFKRRELRLSSGLPASRLTAS